MRANRRPRSQMQLALRPIDALVQPSVEIPIRWYVFAQLTKSGGFSELCSKSEAEKEWVNWSSVSGI